MVSVKREINGATRQSKTEEMLTVVMKVRKSFWKKKLNQPCKEQGKSIPTKYKGPEAKKELEGWGRQKGGQWPWSIVS